MVTLDLLLQINTRPGVAYYGDLDESQDVEVEDDRPLDGIWRLPKMGADGRRKSFPGLQMLFNNSSLLEIKECVE